MNARGLTALERRMRRRYTRATRTPWELNDFPNYYRVELVVDHQSFKLREGCPKAESDWLRDQLAIALARMVTAEKNLTARPRGLNQPGAEKQK